MKRTLLLLMMSVCFCAIGVARNVTLKAVDRPASVVFRSIVSQTGMNFVYSSDLLKDMRVSIDVRNISLKKALSIMFKDSDIEWKIKGKNIVLKQKVRRKKSRGKHIKRQSSSVIPVSTAATPVMLEEVIVVSRLEYPVVETAEIGAKRLTAQEINNTPALLGESDVVKTLQLQPGITESEEGMAGMNVHGGNQDECLYMLDNVPLYQVNHLGGLFSAFNTETIRNIDFFRSSIPAKYDGRLSAYLDVRTKNGNTSGLHGSFRLGLTSGAFNIDGPLGDKTTYSLALRRSWLELISLPMMAIVNSSADDEKKRFRYAFMDLNAKATHRFSDKISGHVSFYFGDDVLKTGSEDKQVPEYGWYSKETSDYRWGNIVAQLGLDMKVSVTTSSELTLAYTRYSSVMKHNYLTKDLYPDRTDETRSATRTDNNINDCIFRADFLWRPGQGSNIRYGAGYTLHSFLPAATQRSYSVGEYLAESRDSTFRYLAHEANIYIEDDWRISDRFRINIGVHASLMAIDGKTYFGYAPRASVSYHPKPNWAVKGAYARTNQYVHQLSQTYLSLPTDQWVPVAGDLEPQSADKLSVGVYWQNQTGDYAASIEGYYKFMHHIIDYRDEYYLQPPIEAWNTQLCSGSGSAKGLDILFEKRYGKLTGHICYSLAWADRTFADKNGGMPFPARFDHRHTINMLINWNINDEISINAAWTGHSGNRVTLIDQIWSSPDFDNESGCDEIPLKTQINNYRLPFYHRLDLSCILHLKRGYWTFGLFNAYCNMNTIAIRRTYDKNHNPVFQKVRLLPVIPSISYTWQF